MSVAERPGPTIRTGAMVGHFRIVRLLGRGGMGEVYLARDTRLGRKVALKLINAGLVASASARQRLMYEAQATASFSHPHIVTIHEVGEHDGSPYFALEYLEGETLRARMAERPGIPAALRLALAIAEALREAHQKGILHRDLKPENVLCPRDGRLRVVDFGLAQPIDAAWRPQSDDGPDDGNPEPRRPLADIVADTNTAPAANSRDESLGFHGTPGYLAPELWNDGEAQPASDVWALGVILYELVYGHHPYAGLTLTTLAAAVGSDDPLPAPRDGARPAAIPDGVEPLIQECLGKDPARRPTAGQVTRRLGQILAGGAHHFDEEESPFRGLLPFTERHAERFFGREVEVAEALERLRDEPILPIIGPSGAGKTSFVQAGLAPRLREQEAWVVLQLRPGAHPLTALARTLALGGRVRGTPRDEDTGRDAIVRSARIDEPRLGDDELAARTAELAASPRRLSLHLRRLAEESGARVMLVVDQLEELYTHTLGDDERHAFLEAICSAADDAADPVRVCFTLRDDYVGRTAEGELARRVLARVLVLRSPGREALAEILTRPLALAGYAFDDPKLVDDMLAAVASEPACLPLLQFTMRLLWERRDRERRRLLRSAYDAIGGVAGALAAHADAVLGTLPEADVRLARALLLRLVTSQRTRRVLPPGELLAGLPADAARVLGRLTEARLVSVRKAPGEDEGELELAHESLIHHWRQLARWIDEGREELVFLEDLEKAAALWERRGRRTDEVWRGEALAEARRMVARLESPLPPTLSQFLAVGEVLDHRAARRRRAVFAGVLGVLTVAAAVAIVVALVIADKERRARAQEIVATRRGEEARRRFAEAQLEGARAALLRGETIEARAKLRGSLEAEDSALGRALWWQVAIDPLVWRKTLSAAAYAIAYSPDGTTVAAGCQDGTIWLLDVETLAVRVLRDTDQVTTLAFTPDGRSLLTGSWSPDARVWDLASGERRLLAGHSAGVWGVATSNDGRLWATASYDRTLRVWPAQGSADPLVLRGHQAQINGVSFRGDGHELASVGWDGTLRLWDDAGRERLMVKASPLPLYSVSYDRTGGELAAAGADGWVRVYDTATGGERRAFHAHERPVQWVRFSPDGKLLATGSDDKTVRLWDAATSAPRAVLGGFGERVIGAVFSPDGRRLATADYAGLLQLWWVDRALASGGDESGHTAPVVGLSFSPDGKRVGSAGYDKTARIWSSDTGGEELRLIGHTHRVFSIDVGAELIATAGQDATIRLWDARTGAERRVLEGHKATIYEVLLSDDGKRLLSGSGDGTARLWDAASGRPLHVLSGHTDAVISVALSHDGRNAATGSSDSVIRLWDTESGRSIGVLRGHGDTVQGLAFSPDDQTLLSGSEDRTVRVWAWRQGGSGRVIGRHEGRIYQVAWHPDGRRAGSASSDQTARIWEVESGAMIVLRGHRGEVNNVEFHPDGRRVATVSDDTTVRIWDVDSGRPVWRAPLLLPKGPVLYTHEGWQALAGSGGAPAMSGWRRVVEATAAQASTTADEAWLCVRTVDGAVELWDTANDRRVLRGTLRAPDGDVAAIPGGCVTLAGGRAELWQAGASDADAHAVPLVPRPDTDADEARTFAVDGGELLVASDRALYAFDLNGRLLGRQRATPGMTAVVRVDGALFGGFRNGSIERLGGGGATFPFDGVPNAPVVRLLAGPSGTIAAGFGNGVVGVWQADSGARLESRRLRGPVLHLVLAGPKLYAASDLGDHTTLDLEVFHLPRCELMKRVWHDIPVIWERGVPVRREIPRGHECAGR